MTNFDLKTAVAFLRCESGGRSDSKAVKAQRAAIWAFARASNYELVAEFGDQRDNNLSCPSGPGFAAMLSLIEARGVQTMIVATAGSFSQDAMAQAVGFAKLRQYGIEIIAADAPGAFLNDVEVGETAARVIEIAGAFEAAMRTAQLRAIGERARIKAGPKLRSRYAELHPEVVLIVKRMHHVAAKKGERLSLRQISATLAEAGHLKDGKPFHPQVINRMIRGPRPGRLK